DAIHHHQIHHLERMRRGEGRWGSKQERGDNQRFHGIDLGMGTFMLCRYPPRGKRAPDCAAPVSPCGPGRRTGTHSDADAEKIPGRSRQPGNCPATIEQFPNRSIPTMKRWLVSMTALALPVFVSAADTPQFDAKRLSDQVRVLSSDAFEGRGPATAGETKTLEYVIDQMQKAGIQPGGDLKDGKRLWTQAVPLLRSEITGTSEISVSVNGKPEALKQGEHIALRAAMDGSKQVSIEGAPLVFVGYGTLAPERNWDDFKG